MTCTAQAQVAAIDYYRMGEADGSISTGLANSTNDSVGGKNLTTSGGPFYTHDIAATAASSVGSVWSMNFFNGTTYAHGVLLSTATDNFGLEGWVKSTTLANNHCVAYNGNTTSNGWGLFQIGNTWQARFGSLAFGSSPVALNTWTHLAVVRDSGTATFYVNGVAAGTTTTAPVAPATPADVFAIASSPPAFNEGLWGEVDEVRAFTFAAGTFMPHQLLINSLTITTTADSGAGSLRQALLSAVQGDTITALTTGTITLASPLPPINVGLTIIGNGLVLNGAGLYPGVLINSGTVAISNMKIQNTLSQGTAGTSGGGGGAGLGAGLFIGNQANVTLSGVSFNQNAAKGGAGGDGVAVSSNGGAGGNFRTGVSIPGKAGGNGQPQVPGTAGSYGGPGGFDFIGFGGGGGGGGTTGGSGAEAANVQSGSGGAGGNPGPGAVGGVGAGGGGGSTGYGGGGGGVGAGAGGGGGGGLGGGGGGGGSGGYGGDGAAGGYGGGGGGGGGGSNGYGQRAQGNHGSGNGAAGAFNGIGGGGGGGLGAGGAIFLLENGTLTLTGAATFSGNSVSGGGAGNGAGNPAASGGTGAGSALFVTGLTGVTLNPGTDNTITIADTIGNDLPLNLGFLTISGAGTVVLSGANSYGYGTTISGGTLLADTPSATGSATGSGSVTISGGTLGGTGNVAGAVNLNSGTIAPGDLNLAGNSTVGTLKTGALTWTSGAAINFQLGATAAVTDLLVVNGALKKSGTGTYQFNFSDGVAAPNACGTVYPVIQATSITGFVASDFSYTYSGSSAVLSASAGAAPGSFSIVGNTVSFTTVLCTQAITNFKATPSNPTYSPSGTFALSAAAGASANPVTFASTTPSICSVSGSTVTILAAGSCGLTSNENGNANYGAAPQLTLNVTISKASQSILLGAAPTVAVGSTGTVSATATSGLTVTTSTTSTTCSITAAGVVTGINAGLCAINATQAGDTNYLAATPASQSFTVAMGSQSISFTSVPSVAVGGTGNIAAAGGGSGMPVTYSTSSSTCTVTSAGIVSGVNAGSCSIAADQAGSANYMAATTVMQGLTIAKASSTTSLSTLCQSTFVENQPYTMNATPDGASPTGSVTFAQSGNVVLCASVPLSAGSAVCTSSSLAVSGTDNQDSYALTATYNGDGNNMSSASAAINVMVLSAGDVVFRNGYETDLPTCPIE